MKEIVILLAMIFSLNTYAKDLTVGCVTKCDIFFKWALNKAASKKGHRVKMVDMSFEYPNINWDQYDAIIIPGGADINPDYYLSQVEPELVEYTRSLDYLVNYSQEGTRRDPIEFGTMKDYFSNDKLKDLPVLGVCRGMQLLAVTQGVPLYVDIKKELGIPNRRYLFDRIYMEPEPSLMNSFFIYSFRAFKRHHQGIRIEYFNEHMDRWPHLKITSYSNSKLIAESLEFSNRPILGVQFHPENDFGFERSLIFGWLIDQAEKRNATKTNLN